MNTQQFTLQSPVDGLNLSVAAMYPDQAPKALIVFSHGMSEHKERYFEFCEYLCNWGFACVIHDHRGHGHSVAQKGDLGYFGVDDTYALVSDLEAVITHMKAQLAGVPIYLFGHSMGSLVARLYLAKHDDHINKLMLCGIPTQNPLAGVGSALAYTILKIKGERYQSKLIHQLALGAYNKVQATQNGWLSKNEQNVTDYNSDPLCGFVFSVGAYRNLFCMLKAAYQPKNYLRKNTSLPIFIVAGEDDPVIGSRQKFLQTVSYIKEMGYQNTSYKLYPNLRHELLNEREKDQVFADAAQFFYKI